MWTCAVFLHHSGTSYCRVGTKNVHMKWCQSYVVHVKRLPKVHIHCQYEGILVGISGLSTIITFTPKKHKIRKIGYFQVAWNWLKSLHIYPNQQYIVSSSWSSKWIMASFKTLILILCTLMYHCVHLRGLHARTQPQAHFWKLFCSPLKTNCGLHKNRLQKCC